MILRTQGDAVSNVRSWPVSGIPFTDWHASFLLRIENHFPDSGHAHAAMHEAEPDPKESFIFPFTAPLREGG